MKSKNNEIAALEKLIQKYQASYYNGEAEISDGEFDLLWDELKKIAPDSEVLKKVGTGFDVDGFPKAKHLIPMGSQEKASNPQEFLAWVKKQIAKIDEINASLTDKKKQLTKIFIVQFKMDGASLELQYEKGILIRAVTRGDGITGDDITPNARRMSGVVQKMNVSFTGGVRGEVIMTHDIWESKYPAKANCRNAANGIMRRKDGEGCENLHLIVYDASAMDDDQFFKDELQKIDWLKKRGFVTSESQSFTAPEDIIAYREKIAKTRDQLPFDIDGLVVKDNETDMSDLRKARPEKQIAFKFELETAFSFLREVIWSENGATYTPVGIIDPVRLAGTTVKRASLNNPDMIRAMELKIGSAVSVVKRGEIIPKIEGLAPNKDISSDETTEIIFPQKCSICNSTLLDAGTRLYCPNPECPKRLLHRLEKWVSVLNIRELGEKLLLQLFEKGIKQIHQLYTIKAEDLAEYDRMGEKSAIKVIRHIQTKRELTLAQFIAGFDFEGIAETTMDKVAGAGFDTLEKLQEASVSDLSAVFGLGEITAKIIADGLKECAKEIKEVLKTKVISIADPPSEETQPLRGISFCFTGELKTMKRGAAEEKIKALGAQAKSAVVKGLSYLVTNDTTSGSSKNKKAKELGIPIIDEDQFIKLIQSAPQKNDKLVQGELF
ncbi:MAG: NAD-dependent DNA ligase LigA [Treponema sp.]|nr:NAD-dependent DNA ligase LigA [Treponema sp.]MCL2251526.1 NAD-dependent DNA ligase LigA [Treponema sp.]